MKDNDFTKYIQAVIHVLDLDLERDLIPGVTLRCFINTCEQHPGWHEQIMYAMDRINYEHLFPNGPGTTPESIEDTKAQMYAYFAHFASMASINGYTFSD